MKKILFFFVFLLVLDFLTKLATIWWIPYMSPLDRLYPFGGIPVASFSGITFSLNYVGNTGAAWGLFAGHSGILFFIRTIIIVGMTFYLLFFQKGTGYPKFPLWVIITGAIGNSLDYLFYGHVVDFLHFTFWGFSFPVFNLADSYITMGVLGLMLSRSQKQPQLL